MPLDATRQRALQQNLLFNLFGTLCGIFLIMYGAHQLSVMARSRFPRLFDQGQARLLSKKTLPYERDDAGYELSFALTNQHNKTQKITIFDQELYRYLDRLSNPTQRTFSYQVAKHPTKNWVFLKLGSYRHSPKPTATSAWILMLGIIGSGIALVIAAFRSVKEQKRKLAFEQLLAENEARRQAKHAQSPHSKGLHETT